MSFTSSIEEIVAANENGLLGCHDSWKRIPLINVASILNGFPFDSNHFTKASGVPLIRIRDVLRGETETYFTGEIPEGYWIEDGDLLIGMDGDFNSAQWSGRRALLNQRVCKLTPNKDFYDRSLLYRAIGGYLQAINANTPSVTVKHLSSKTVSQIPLPLPPLAEQKRIADKLEAVLGRVDACRSRLDRVPALLKRFRQSVLAAAVSGKLTEVWREEQKCSQTGLDVIELDRAAKAELLRRDPSLAKKKSTLESQINEEYVFVLPETWAFTTWGTVSEWVTYGFTRPMPETKSGCRLVTAKDVTNFNLDLEGCRYTSPEAFEALSDKDRPKPGDLLLTKDGSIGRAALVRPDVPFCINQSVAVCWLRSSSMDRSFLEMVANAEFTQAFIREKAQGMAIQHLSITDFAQCPLPVPPGEEQQEIVRRVEALFAFADRIEARLATARKTVERLTPATLAKAFRGELVPQDSNDEPASALLERLLAQNDPAAAKPKRGRQPKSTSA